MVPFLVSHFLVFELAQRLPVSFELVLARSLLGFGLPVVFWLPTLFGIGLLVVFWLAPAFKILIVYVLVLFQTTLVIPQPLLYQYRWFFHAIGMSREGLPWASNPQLLLNQCPWFVDAIDMLS